jgi:hypothetical protein
MNDRPVHVTDNPTDEHRVEEQRTVIGAGRARQANADAECPSHDPPPPGRTQRSQGCERDGGHDRRPGHRPQTLLERRRAHHPHEKPQHRDTSDQAQQQRAEPAHGPTETDRN